MDVGDIANIPEVLGYYREDGKSITTEKKELLIQQNGEIVAASLKRNLGIVLSERQKRYFTGWTNFPASKEKRLGGNEQAQAGKDLQDLLLKICKRNRQIHYYYQKALLRTLRAEWIRIQYGIPFLLPENEILQEDLFQEMNLLSVLMIKGKIFQKNYHGIYRKYKKIQSILKA